MAEIIGVVVSAVACVAQCFSPSVGHRINRWCEFKRNSKILKTKVKTLKAERMSIQHDVDAAKRDGDGIKENVRDWMERAEEIELEIQKWLERASKIIGDDQEAGEIIKDEETAAAVEAAKKRCFKGLCPNLKSRFQLSKEAETLLEDVVKHLEAGKFDKISYRVIPEDPRLSSKDYVAFKSRTSTIKNVISSFNDPNVKIVGIYGMGGIGKTTLAKEVANQSKINKLFDLVIFVEVTEKPDNMKIQREIAERLGLTLSSEDTEAIIARMLCHVLKNEKKILIIFDNIWDHLDLQAIGIPLGDECKVCKVLMTSRSIDLLEKMDSQQNFPVELLDDEEAWQLFKKMSRDNIEGSEFESVAKEVANKCAHLPIVVVTVARALRNKKLFEWDDALQRLKAHSSENMVDILKSIELSYNYLSEVLKKTIMLIRYANLTSIDELLMFGMGLDLFEGYTELEGRRKRVRKLVQQLKDSCLLFDGNTTNEDFSMHDVVREAVISIASREDVFTSERPDENTLKVCNSIVLYEDMSGELQQQVSECEQLKLLAVWGARSNSESDSSLKIPDQFFIKMTKLKVLHLAYMNLSSLPSSLRFLTNLQALRLYKCQLDDITTIGHLKELEILSLKSSIIRQLPVELGDLTALKSLDLRKTDSENLPQLIPPNVFSSSSRLEELYMGDFRGWEKEGLNKDRNVSLDELKHLPNLTCLQIQIRDAEAIPGDLFFDKLEWYSIEIGQNPRKLNDDWIHGSCRKFSLLLINTNIYLNDGHIMKLKNIEVLTLFGSQDTENVLYGLDRDGFQQLKYLQVENNDKLLCIVDAMEDATNNAFPILESLSIQHVMNLEKICCGQLTTGSSFSQLRKIKVKHCAKLVNIFSFSIARRLQLLQSIVISDCKNMKEIFGIERENESNCNISKVIDNIELSQLHKLKLRSLPQLKSLEYNNYGSDTLFTGQVVLASLEVLEIYKLNVERIWQNQFAAMPSSIQNLTRLILKGCNNLRHVFSSSLIRSSVRLQHLQIEDCHCLEEIVVIDERTDVVFPQLRFLKLYNLENLSKFCTGDSVDLPSLKYLVIMGCPKFKDFLVKNMSTDLTEISSPFFNEKVVLSNLEYFELRSTNVERIWPNQFAVPSFGFTNLTELILKDSNNMRCLFSFSIIRSFDGLQSLQICKCQNLEVLFDLNGPNFEDSKSSPCFQKLKEVFIDVCDSLKHVFPASLVSSLSQLEYLRIRRCGALEDIVFVAKEDSKKCPRFVFPRVISLILHDLPNLTTFFSGRYTTKWPALKNLNVWNLSLRLESSNESQDLGQKVFPKLETLTVQGKSISSLNFFKGVFK